MTYEEKIARIMFLREHRRNLLIERCKEDIPAKKKIIVDHELKQIKKTLRKLDPHGIFPP
tara:strand:- start:2837 stop:3016 length:180 start_codon:yes stop_codon:yes gene_type:complete